MVSGTRTRRDYAVDCMTWIGSGRVPELDQCSGRLIEGQHSWHSVVTNIDKLIVRKHGAGHSDFIRHGQRTVLMSQCIHVESDNRCVSPFSLWLSQASRHATEFFCIRSFVV